MWSEYHDASSGYPYWVNSETSETSWDPPPAAEAGSPATAAEGTCTTGAWVECFDDASGYPYWINSASGESTWERPRTAVASAASETRAAAASPASLGAPRDRVLSIGTRFAQQLAEVEAAPFRYSLRYSLRRDTYGYSTAALCASSSAASGQGARSKLRDAEPQPPFPYTNSVIVRIVLHTFTRKIDASLRLFACLYNGWTGALVLQSEMRTRSAHGEAVAFAPRLLALRNVRGARSGCSECPAASSALHEEGLGAPPMFDAPLLLCVHGVRCARRGGADAPLTGERLLLGEQAISLSWLWSQLGDALPVLACDDARWSAGAEGGSSEQSSEGPGAVSSAALSGASTLCTVMLHTTTFEELAWLPAALPLMRRASAQKGAAALFALYDIGGRGALARNATKRYVEEVLAQYAAIAPRALLGTADEGGLGGSAGGAGGGASSMLSRLLLPRFGGRLNLGATAGVELGTTAEKIVSFASRLTAELFAKENLPAGRSEMDLPHFKAWYARRLALLDGASGRVAGGATFASRVGVTPRARVLQWVADEVAAPAVKPFPTTNHIVLRVTLVSTRGESSGSGSGRAAAEHALHCGRTLRVTVSVAGCAATAWESEALAPGGAGTSTSNGIGAAGGASISWRPRVLCLENVRGTHTHRLLAAPPRGDAIYDARLTVRIMDAGVEGGVVGGRSGGGAAECRACVGTLETSLAELWTGLGVVRDCPQWPGRGLLLDAVSFEEFAFLPNAQWSLGRCPAALFARALFALYDTNGDRELSSRAMAASIADVLSAYFELCPPAMHSAQHAVAVQHAAEADAAAGAAARGEAGAAAAAARSAAASAAARAADDFCDPMELAAEMAGATVRLIVGDTGGSTLVSHLVGRVTEAGFVAWFRDHVEEQRRVCSPPGSNKPVAPQWKRLRPSWQVASPEWLRQRLDPAFAGGRAEVADAGARARAKSISLQGNPLRQALRAQQSPTAIL